MCSVVVALSTYLVVMTGDRAKNILLLKTPPCVHTGTEMADSLPPLPLCLNGRIAPKFFTRGPCRVPTRLVFKTCLGGHCERFHTFYCFFLFLYEGAAKQKKVVMHDPSAALLPLVLNDFVAPRVQSGGRWVCLRVSLDMTSLHGH